MVFKVANVGRDAGNGRGNRTTVLHELLARLGRKWGWGGGSCHTTVTEVIVGDFEKNPLKVLKICFVGVVRIIFYPQEVPNQLTDSFLLIFFG